MNDETLIQFGSAIKALGNGKVGGYLVRFSDASAPDLDGEFFTKATDFDVEPGDPTRIYYKHGLDPVLKRRKLGTGTLAIDDVGVWVEAQLSLRDDYEAAIYGMAEAGKLGWSSGTLPNLVEKEAAGKAIHIKAWPLGKDASMTPTPAAGLIATQVTTLKTWAAWQDGQSAEPAQAVNISAASAEAAPAGASTAPATVATSSQATTVILEDHNMTDNTQPDLTGVLDAIKAQGAAIAELGNQFKALAAAPPVNNVGVAVKEDEADRALKGNPFKSFGEQLLAVRHAALYGETDKRLLPLKAILGANESVPSEGGFLVSTAENRAIDKKMWDSSVFASRAAQSTIPQGANSAAYYGRDEDSRANGSRYGGITGYRVAEGATITASGAQKFYTYTLRPKKYAAIAYATDEVIADASMLEQEIMEAVPQELAFMVDDDMFRGLGVAGAHGVTNHAALITITKETGQAAATIVYQNLLKMWARRYARGRYAWFVNQDCGPQLDQLVQVAGTGAMPPNFIDYGPDGILRIKGAPVIETEFNATLGTVGDILLADWSQYKLATIGGVQSASSIHVQFLTDQMCYRFTRRVDGLPTWKSALTPYQGSNTQSPFIVLATRA